MRDVVLISLWNYDISIRSEYLQYLCFILKHPSFTFFHFNCLFCLTWSNFFFIFRNIVLNKTINLISSLKKKNYLLQISSWQAIDLCVCVIWEISISFTTETRRDTLLAFSVTDNKEQVGYMVVKGSIVWQGQSPWTVELRPQQKPRKENYRVV